MTLAELKASFGDIASSFDASLLALGELAGVVRDAGAIEKMASVMAAVAAARLAGCGPAKVGAGQAVRSLAQASGTSLPEATRR